MPRYLDRLPPLAREQMNPAQQAAADEVDRRPSQGRQGAVHSSCCAAPELLARLQKVGEYLRFENSLPPRLSEFATLVVVAHLDPAVRVVRATVPLALKEGTSPETISAHCARVAGPASMSPDEALVYDFTLELTRHHGVSDDTFGRCVARFGERALVDLVGTIGYFAWMSMILNVAHTPGRRGRRRRGAALAAVITEFAASAATSTRSPQLPAVPVQHPWALAIGGLLSMAAANGIDRFIYTPILPVMVEALGLTASQAGLIASANYLGYLLGALFAAQPGLQGSRRRWLLAALATSAICTAGLALAVSLPPMLVLRFSSGFAGAVAIIMAIALVVERLAAGGRGYLAPVHFAGVGVGIACSAIIVAGLRFAGHGWRSMWICAGAASLCCLVVAARLIRNGTGEAASAAAGAGDRSTIGPRFRLLIAANTR